MPPKLNVLKSCTFTQIQNCQKHIIFWKEQSQFLSKVPRIAINAVGGRGALFAINVQMYKKELCTCQNNDTE
jgi:hypothetical protein